MLFVLCWNTVVWRIFSYTKIILREVNFCLILASTQENKTENGFFLNLNHKDSKGDSALSLAVAMDMQRLVPELILGVYCVK